MFCKDALRSNRPTSQLNSIRGKRYDSLFSKKSASHHRVVNTRTKLFYVDLDPHHIEANDIHGSISKELTLL